MQINTSTILKEKGLKVTPQRIAVYDTLLQCNHHPTADYIIEQIKVEHPSIAIGTIYKVLEFLVENQLINKVKTDKDVMRYDPLIKAHHHLYCKKTDKIEDYINEELTLLIESYLKKSPIKNFTIQDIKLQITGTFKKTKK